MSDATGIARFIFAIGEMARGAVTPSIPPVWERHLLDAGHPPRVTFTHHEYDEVEGNPSDNLVQHSFFFVPNQISSLRQLLPLHLRQCTRFELLTACLWRCRTAAMSPNPEQEMRMLCVVNVRSRFNPPLPLGYYGNAFVFPAAITTARNLCQNPLGYTVELVKQAKASVTEEYVKSVAALMVLKSKKVHFTEAGSFLVSDVKNFGFGDIDFGCGKAFKGGPVEAFGPVSYFMSAEDKKGESGMLVIISLPPPAMERFSKEVDNMLKGASQLRKPTLISSAL